jgi:hypothetical protein
VGLPENADHAALDAAITVHVRGLPARPARKSALMRATTIGRSACRAGIDEYQSEASVSLPTSAVEQRVVNDNRAFQVHFLKVRAGRCFLEVEGQQEAVKDRFVFISIRGLLTCV